MIEGLPMLLGQPITKTQRNDYKYPFELGIKPGKASSNLGIMLSPTPGDAPINATNICITPINIEQDN